MANPFASWIDEFQKLARSSSQPKWHGELQFLHDSVVPICEDALAIGETVHAHAFLHQFASKYQEVISIVVTDVSDPKLKRVTLLLLGALASLFGFQTPDVNDDLSLFCVDMLSLSPLTDDKVISLQEAMLILQGMEHWTIVSRSRFSCW